jgi:hypothetical protein
MDQKYLYNSRQVVQVKQIAHDVFQLFVIKRPAVLT